MVSSTDSVRLGFTGLGNRGSSLLNLCLDMNDVSIAAICDVQSRHRRRIEERVLDAGKPEPTGYERHEEMVDCEDLDGVIITAPWRFHIPMAITAMESNVFPAMDVGPASSIEECWDLVRTSERMGVSCMLLENCYYYRDCLAILRMVREGVFGDLVHCRGGYCHELRERLVTGTATGLNRGGGRDFRGVHHEMHNGDTYPTHGVGPMAKCLDINRGNRFLSLVSTASKAVGLETWAETNLEEEHPGRDVDWSKGDVITTTLSCANGETLALVHDVSLPRPYSNEYHVQGTGGIWRRDTDPFQVERSPCDHDERYGRIHLEQCSPSHAWEPFQTYLEQYEHPLWQRYLAVGPKAGHGGVDHLMLRAYIETVTRNTQPPIDVYDAATWMAISPLSERSVTLGERVAVPDFTRGDWRSKEPTFVVSESP